MLTLSMSSFPRREGTSLFNWAPIYFHPIPTSPERLVIAVIVADSNRATLVEANRLEKLNCLFEAESADVLEAATLSLKALQEDIEGRGVDVLRTFHAPMSGVSIGEVAVVEGRGFEEVGCLSLRSISSLWGVPRTEIARQIEVPWQLVERHSAANDSPPRVKVPGAVMEYVAKRNSELLSNFATARAARERLQRANPHTPILDYSGRRVAANFGALESNHSSSVNAVKRRMWDLALDRIREDQANKSHREHEMLVRAPQHASEGISELVLQRIRKALIDLEKEADLNEIRLRPLPSVSAIGDHLLQLEEAA